LGGTGYLSGAARCPDRGHRRVHGSGLRAAQQRQQGPRRSGHVMRELLDLTRELADKELRPEVDSAEREGRFPRDACRVCGRSVLPVLPSPERWAGVGQPYEVYLQVVEELARAWLTVGLGVSVHTLTCLPLAAFGTDKQREAWLPEMLGGELLGAYCLSEPQSGSDAAALATAAMA